MRNSTDVFHLAIPCKDLDETVEFYVYGLGCKLARRRDDRVTLEFFGDQIVCHLDPDSVVPKPEFYPRHFGVTFREREDFDRLFMLAKKRRLEFFREWKRRFEGEVEAHVFFALIDPANNILEFKHYDDPRMMH